MTNNNKINEQQSIRQNRKIPSPKPSLKPMQQEKNQHKTPIIPFENPKAKMGDEDDHTHSHFPINALRVRPYIENQSAKHCRVP